MIFYLSMIESQEDKDKFEYIYTNYRYTMLYEARQVLKDEHMAEDAVHESFIKIIKIISKKISLENCNKLKRFLVLIVRHKSIDIIRKNDKVETIPIENIQDIKKSFGMMCWIKLKNANRTYSEVSRTSKTESSNFVTKSNTYSYVKGKTYKLTVTGQVYVGTTYENVENSITATY